MKNWEDFLKELISHELWFEYASSHHKPETFEKAARKVYMQGVADGVLKPIQESRKHVYNILAQMPHDKVKVNWIQKALESTKKEEAKEWKPASPEHVDKCVAEFDAMMKNSTMMNAFPRVGHKQAIEEGQWLPKKDAPYPVTSAEEAYIKDRHLAYIEYAYEPRSGEKMPGVMSEQEFNLEYDRLILNQKGL